MTQPEAETPVSFTAEQLDEIHKKIKEHNQQLLRELRGYGQTIDPAVIAWVRLETLIDGIFGPEDRKRFEIQFEQAMVDKLEKAASEIRQARIASPVTGDQLTQSGLVLPGSLQR